MAQRGNQSLGIEHGFVLEHVIDAAGQFDGQNGVGLELVAVHAGFEALVEWAQERLIAFGDDGRFAKSPAEIRVAEFTPSEAFDLARAGDGAFDQAAIAQEVFDGGKELDVADLIEDGQTEALADAGDGLQ